MSERLTPSQRGEIRARADKTRNRIHNTEATMYALLSDDYSEAFAVFAAHAPLDIPALLADADLADAEIAALRADLSALREAGRWVDAEESTPDIGQLVLLYLPDKEIDKMRVGEYLGEGDYRTGNRLFRGREIAAWRPLPPAPAEDIIVLTTKADTAPTAPEVPDAD